MEKAWKNNNTLRESKGKRLKECKCSANVPYNFKFTIDSSYNDIPQDTRDEIEEKIEDKLYELDVEKRWNNVTKEQELLYSVDDVCFAENKDEITIDFYKYDDFDCAWDRDGCTDYLDGEDVYAGVCERVEKIVKDTFAEFGIKVTSFKSSNVDDIEEELWEAAEFASEPDYDPDDDYDYYADRY